MEKYKDYIARTQQDRIALDTLYTLEKILELFKSKYDDERIANDEEIKCMMGGVINAQTTQKKPRKKNGGDK